MIDGTANKIYVYPKSTRKAILTCMLVFWYLEDTHTHTHKHTHTQKQPISIFVSIFFLPNPPPSLAIYPSPVCVGEPVVLNLSSSSSSVGLQPLVGSEVAQAPSNFV